MKPVTLITICMLIFNAYAQTKKTIAVDDFSFSGITSGEADALTEKLRFKLFEIGTYRVIERQKMTEILKEQGFQKSGACKEEECAIEIGQLLGVSEIISGNIGKIGRTYTVSARVIDVGTGEITSMVNEDCKCPLDEVLSHTIEDIAIKISALHTDKKEKFAPSTTMRNDTGTRLKPAIIIPVGTALIGGGVAAILFATNSQSGAGSDSPDNSNDQRDGGIQLQW